MKKSISILYLSIMLFSNLMLAQGDFNFKSNEYKSASWLEKNCVNCGEYYNPTCRLEEFKYLGKVGNDLYYYSKILEYDPEAGDLISDDGYNLRKVIIFKGKDKNKLKPVYTTSGTFDVYEHVEPEFVSTKNGKFIHIFISNGNSGDDDDSEYFILKKDHWFKIFIPDFGEAISKVVPKKYKFGCRGGWIDLKQMIYFQQVYKENDACCCPSGGTVKCYIKLTSDNKIGIKKSEYFPNLQVEKYY